MKNKKNTIYILIALIIIGLVVIFYKNKSINFYLEGEDTITLKYGSVYNEPGFIAQNGFGKDLSDYVNVTSKVDTSKPGTYEVSYELDDKVLKRTVIVGEATSNDIEIVLNGDKELLVIKDSKYQELGAYVVSKYS